MNFYLLTCFLVFILQFSFSITKICRNKVELVFHPLRHCQRSNKTAIAFSNFETLKDCMEFTTKHRGLAFNFSPKDRFKKNLFKVIKFNGTEKENVTKIDYDEEFYNCEVLDCPEYKNLFSIINDTRFDYYTLYARPPRELKIK